MSWQTMISRPISVLLAGVIVILLLLAGTSASTQAITAGRIGTPTWTLRPEDGEVDDYQCEDFRPDLTDTAEAAALDATDTAGTASPTPSSTATAYPGYLPPGTAAAATTTAAGRRPAPVRQLPRARPRRQAALNRALLPRARPAPPPPMPPPILHESVPTRRRLRHPMS
ncbi:MAG: hypothetical protein U0Z44_11355 [Kouleothrix sp.]